MKPYLVPGKDHSIAVLVTDETNPFAATPGAGLTVKVQLSDSRGGPAIDPALIFNAVEQDMTPAGYSGRLYLAMIIGATAKPFLVSRVGASVFAQPFVGTQPLEPIELDVLNAPPA